MIVTLGGQPLTSSKVGLIAVRNAALPQVIYTSTKRGGFSGNKMVTPTFGSYKFIFEWVIVGTSFSDLAIQRRAFVGLLGGIHSAGPKTLKITTEDGAVFQIDVKAFDVTGDLQAGDTIMSTISTTLECQYPFLQSAYPSNIDIQIFNGGGFAVPFAIPFDMSAGHTTTIMITSNGNYPAYPTFTFVGPLTNPSFTNNTTGDTFSLSQTLASSANSIVVDSYLRTVVIQPSGNNGRQYFSGSFFTIPVGTSSFTLGNANNTDVGKVTVSFRDTVLGI